MPSRFAERARVLSSALATIALLVAVAVPRAQQAAAPELTLPLAEGSVRFAAMGDNGTGDREQYEVAKQMARWHEAFPFTFVIMLGDNLYGRERASDYERKFEIPYKPLLDAGVKFYASLGNHDDPQQRFYKLFNMGGERYYTFKEGHVRFFALDTDYWTEEQRDWLVRELAAATEPWKIVFGHHPIYSSGRRHGPSLQLRAVLEPLLVKHGVNVMFAGHEHFYERIKPQKGVHYFISGAAGKLRRNGLRENSEITARGFDLDQHFMLIEVTDDTLHFQAVSRTGETIDSGAIAREPDATAATVGKGP